MCQDYDGASEKWHEFYSHTQAKIVHAVSSHTPADLIRMRADASQPDMGLRTWPNANIRKGDVVVSKNYLSDMEMKELNRLTTLLLDIFEDRMDIRRLTLMSEASSLLDQQLKSLGRSVLRDGGRVSMIDAKKYAEGQYAKFKAAETKLRQEQADQAIAAIKSEQKALGKRKS